MSIHKDKVFIDNLSIDDYNKMIDIQYITLNGCKVYINSYDGEVSFWEGYLDISPLDYKKKSSQIIKSILTFLRNQSIYAYQITQKDSVLKIPFGSQKSLIQFKNLKKITIENVQLKIINSPG